MSRTTAEAMEVPLTKPVNRSLVVIAALLIQLCLGAIYSWSVFTPPLKEAPFLFSNTQTQAIFSISLLTFAIVMVLAGRWQAKSGPRIVSLLGGIVLGAGYILAGLFGHTFVSQILFIGLIGGAGIGLAYVCPISVGMKWFPDKKGLITGVAVAGFGFGALIWVKLAGSWGGLLESMGVLKVFLLYGIIFAAAVTVGSIWMVNPPAGWKPAGWEPPAPAEGADSKVGLEGLLPGAMLRQKGFYSLWVMFIFSSMAGLMIIGNIKLFGIEALRTSAAAMSEEQASIIAGTAMAVFYSIANGLGRIIWGGISDRTGRKAALALMLGLQGIVMLVFFWMGSSEYLLYLGATLIGFNFGGNFALFPAATADLFGAKNVGLNYGYVFTAYGVGGIVGPIMAGIIRDVFQNWQATFTICGVALLVATGIALTLRFRKN